jgi:hypothetical protein
MELSPSPIHGLIKNLTEMNHKGADVIKSIKNFDLLKESLHELDKMIEMDSLKNAVTRQIKFLLVNHKGSSGFGYEGHMLHTVIYGPPGVGKTKVCSILVKIWLALGILKDPTALQRDNDNTNDNTTNDNNNNDNNDDNNDNTNDNNNNDSNNNRVGKDLVYFLKTINTLTASNKMRYEVIESLQKHISDIKHQIIKSCQGLLRLKNSISNSNNSDEGKSLYDTISNHTNNNAMNNSLRELDGIHKILTENANLTIPEENIKFSTTIIDTSSLEDHSNNNNDNNSRNVDTPMNSPKPKNPNIIYPMFIDISEGNGGNPDTDKTSTSNNILRIVGREDLVGGFLGQTALKTEKILNESLGKVLFIDEAYAIVNDEKDSYGREALTVINRFMSEHSDELIVIFAGYKDLMEQTIFKLQPGLKSRCTWVFEVDGYSTDGLVKIFKQQLEENGWKLSPEINLTQMFKDHGDFPGYGRDTNRLVFYCKTCYSEYVFDTDTDHDKIITKSILKQGLDLLKTHQIDKSDSGDKLSYFI